MPLPGGGLSQVSATVDNFWPGVHNIVSPTALKLNFPQS